MGASRGSDLELQNLFKSLYALQQVCWRHSGDPLADRCIERLKRPITELLGFAVMGVLQEMRLHPADPQVQSVGLRILKAIIHENPIARQMVLLNGGVETLVVGVEHHLTDEGLLTEALEAIDEIQGLPSLLHALQHLKDSAPGVRAALWAFCESARVRWSEVQKLPPHSLISTLLLAVEAHKGDACIVTSGLQLLGDLTLEGPHLRDPFAAAGGWEWLLQVLEIHTDTYKVQLHGCKVLSSLGLGGTSADTYAARSAALLERTICKYSDNECVLYWALWAVQRLNGARALVAPLQAGAFTTPSAAVAALQCLGAIQFGQSDGACIGDMPAIIDAVVRTMGGFSERLDVCYEGIVVLGHAAEFVVGHADQSGSANMEQLPSSVQLATSTLLQLIRARYSDANTVRAACQSLAQIVEASRADSPVRASICNALFDPEAGNQGDRGEHLLSKVGACHVANDGLQTTVMWITGIAYGVAAVVKQMAEHPSSHAVQLASIRTLGMLYGERIDIDSTDMQVLPDALRAVVVSMGRFPENLVLQQHACYALCVMAEHGVDMNGLIPEDALLQCAAAVAGALALVQGRRDSGRDPSSYNALYLRKEAMRCIAAICGLKPSLGRWLCDKGLDRVLTDALMSTADSMWDGQRDREAEETLRLELLALSYVLGPSAVIRESLQRWGGAKPSVARAAADAVVELARSASRIEAATVCAHNVGGGVGAALDATAVAAVLAPVQALREAGCGAELLAAMRVHAGDEDLQGRLHLAVGFVGGPAA